MSESVQIPQELYDDICSYFLRPIPDADAEADLWDRIRSLLESKLHTDICNDLYSQYRRPPAPAECEQALQAYLDAVGGGLISGPC